MAATRLRPWASALALLLVGDDLLGGEAWALAPCTMTVPAGENFNEYIVNTWRNNVADVVCVEPGVVMGYPSANLYTESAYPTTIQSTGARATIPGQLVVNAGADVTLINLAFDYAPDFNVPTEIYSFFSSFFTGATVMAPLLVNNGTLRLQDVEFDGGNLLVGVLAVDSLVTLDSVIMRDFGSARPLITGFTAAAAATDGLIVQNSSFSDNDAGAILAVGTGAVRPPIQIGDINGASTVSFSNNAGAGGTDIEVRSLDLALYHADFAISSVSGPADIGGVDFPGAPIFLYEGSGVMQDLAFDRIEQTPRTSDSYGAVYAYLNGHSLTVDRAEIIGQAHPAPTFKVFAEQTGADTVTLRALHLQPAAGEIPPIAYLHGVDDATLSGVVMDGAGGDISTTENYLLSLDNVQIARVDALTLCNIDALAASQAVFTAINSALQLHHAHMQNVNMIGPLIYGSSGTNFEIYNNTFWQSTTPVGVVSGSYETLDFINNIAGRLDRVLDLGAIPAGQVSYNLIWDNTEGMVGSSVYYDGGSHITEDPDFGSYDPSRCDSLPYPIAGSPVTGAGHPTRYQENGGPADIGRFPAGEGGDTGGSGDSGDSGDSGSVDSGDTATLNDGDGDGVPAGEDCDDADASIYPGAPDTPNDGIDQDCSDTDSGSVLVGGSACGCSGDKIDAGAAGVGLLWLGALRRRGDRAVRERRGQ